MTAQKQTDADEMDHLKQSLVAVKINLTLSILLVPDGKDLPKVQVHVIDLGDKNGCHCLIKCGTIHVYSGSHWQHKTRHTLVHVVVLLQAAEGDGKGCWTEGKISLALVSQTIYIILNYYMKVFFNSTQTAHYFALSLFPTYLNQAIKDTDIS